MIDKDLDRSAQYELERRVQEVEKQIQLVNRDVGLQTEQMKSLVNLNLTQKADFRDIDNLNHLIT